jgi:cytoskeleton protein RodZ
MAKGNFGERLKREREMREVTLNEVTQATRIGPRFLEALENEDWAKLPGGVFNRGFVRAIAKFLGLDEEGLLSEYDLARGEQKIEAPAPYENRLPSPPKWIPALAILVLLLVVAGLFYAGRYAWHRYAAHRATQQSSAASLQIQPGPVPAGTSAAASSSDQTSAAANSASATLNLSVSTSAATRVRILANGNLLLDAELPAGENRRFPAREQFEVTAADSSAVLLELNGQVMRPLGAPGSSGTIVLTQKDLRQASGGTSQP